MSPTNPLTWKCPELSHPDYDLRWEIEQLRSLAAEIINRHRNWSVRLDHEDPTVIHFDVLRSDLKIGEVYVNRKARGSSEPTYTAYFGMSQNEHHGDSIQAIVAMLENVVGE